MNRHQRRRAPKLGIELTVNIDLGRCLMNGETVPQCYACNKPAPDWEWPDGPAKLGYGVAVINGQMRVPVCETCWNSEDGVDAIFRKFMNSPDLQIKEGGDLGDVLDALEDKATQTTH